MKKRPVRILRRAARDLLEIRSYLEVELDTDAATVLDEIMGGIERLGSLPHSGARPRDARLRELGFRCLIRHRYIVFYKIGAWGVRVYRVLHQKRAYERLL